MTFYADLHVHSKYSRATSRNCDLENLAIWARKKGIGIVATGDFTHPAWRAELKEKLVPAEPGLFRLRPDLERFVEEWLPAACRSRRTAVRFMLSVEISTIYKKFDKTRKIHHLIYTPDFESTDRVVDSLSRIGNLHSDGRPILGLDSRHLLEIALESGPGSYLVPAHIWTPWFAALGSKSGFDAIDECYGDLAPHIFAVETGLSSDPPMNWRVSSLDRFRLVSNSDAHSPEKLGREVCVFDTELDYFALRRALETGEGYEGTLEFFPEEGKYHLDGHRNCSVRLSPGETRAREGLCPACGKPLTVGVMHRVEDLADRPVDTAPPETAGSMQSLIPLPEILSELHQVGPKSKRVARHYESLLGQLGPELQLLNTVPLEDIAPASSSLVTEAVSRLRRQEVIRQAGYDGVYGTIRLFEDAELHRYTRGRPLFGDGSEASASGARERRSSIREPRTPTRPGGGEGRSPLSDGEPARAPATADESRATASGTVEASDSAVREQMAKWADSPSFGAGTVEVPDSAVREPPAQRPSLERAAPHDRTTDSEGRGRTRDRPPPERAAPIDRAADLLAGLDAGQRRAVETVDGPLLVVAGPGSGKTRTLTGRIAHLVTIHGVPASCCLAITFTRRAAGEMRDRLRALLPDAWEQIPIHTFHSLGLSLATEHHNAAGLQRGFRVASEVERIQLLRDTLGIPERRARARLSGISHAKRTGGLPSDEVPGEVFEAYEHAMEARNLCDFDDLVIRAAHALEAEPALRAEYRRRYRWVSIDEYQDVDEQQVRLVKLLVARDGNICAIGDPDQAIYGFRGADVRFFSEFRRDFPGAAVVRLSRNYRSDRNIVTLSSQVIAGSGSAARAVRVVEDTRNGGDSEPPGAVPVAQDTQDLVTIHEATTEKAEAEFIVRTLERALGGHSFFSIDSGRTDDGRGQDFSFSDFAVLYRTEAQVPALVEALRRSGMPVQHRSHRRLMEHPGVTAVMEALRESPGTGSVRERLEAVRAGEDGRGAQIAQARDLLRPAAVACGENLERFLSDLSLGTEIDTWDPRADRISLLTLHAAKGLEFPVVFIAGCENGLLPLTWGKASREVLDEERRLFYVGVTRARKKLLLSRARKRAWRGKIREFPPSPYLADIEEQLLERLRSQPDGKRAHDRDSQLKLFS